MTDTNPEPPVLLYPFRFVDPVTGRWVRARDRAERRELEQRYKRWEITGDPEIRHVNAGTFSPFR
jgi:hypothetical protein